MNRKDKISLINQLELGNIPIEMFQKPKVLIEKISKKEFKGSSRALHDEDLNINEFNLSRSGINPFTGCFYGIIKILILS